MNEALYKAVRQRVAALVALCEIGDCKPGSLELELRVGAFDNTGRMTLGVHPGLWYAAFEHMSRATNVRIVASYSRVEKDPDLDGARIVHSDNHCTCRRELKQAVMAASDMLVSNGGLCAVRVAASREIVLKENACDSGMLETPCYMMRDRERRSVYLVGNGERSCWRFDFTRVNEKEGYELEIELESTRALALTSDQNTGERVDAIMAQLGSMIQCLLGSLEQAERLHWPRVHQVAAERAQRQAVLTGRR